MKFLGLLFALSVAAGSASAANIIAFKGTPTTLQGASVYPEAVVTTPSGPVSLKLTGRGTRTKLGGFVKVYVAASYVQDLDAWKKATAADKNIYADPDRKTLMDAVVAQPVRVLVLTMVTDLGGSAITKSFSDSLKQNGVPMTAPGIQDVLGNFDITLKKGESAAIATFADGKSQNVTMEALNKSAKVVADDLGTNFWKIWFKKGDSELLTLQKALVGSAQ